ncbi:MAG: hypothetical protein U1E87_09440 [Alphaproteobacteria bacterium]
MIAHFFEYRRWASHLKLREHFRRARVALLTGVSFLTACLAASELTTHLPWPLAARIVSRGSSSSGGSRSGTPQNFCSMAGGP